MTDINLSQFKDLFVNDTSENLQKINEGLMYIEKNRSDMAKVEDLMRFSHSIKGAAATMTYTKLAYLTHVMEDVFDYIRHGQIAITDEIISLLFQAVDQIESCLQSIKNSDTETDINGFAEIIKQTTKVATVGIGKSNNKWETPAQTQTAALTQTATPTQTTPQSETPANPGTADNNALDYIRIPIKKLDKLLNLSEELVIQKLRLEEDPNETHIKKNAEKLGKVISEMQYQVMESRLIPVNQVFFRFPRMIHDLAAQQNKKIEFVMENGDIELDRSIVEKVAEPIMHILRNAVDHGIETEGKITVSAKRKQDRVAISITDNGKGIDLEKIISLSVKRGYIPESDYQKYKKAIPNKPAVLPQMFDAILFHSDISTNESVTQVSGRGVGLSAVKKFVDSVNGRIIVHLLEKGTCFEMEIPYSLAMIEVLLVKVGSFIYAIPVSTVKKSIEMDSNEITKIFDQETGIYNNNQLPVINLHSLFKHTDLKNTAQTKRLLVLVENEGNLYALGIDEIIKQKEVIIKPLASILRQSKFFSGVTIMGSGQVIPVLDISGITKYITTNYE